jgi:hypothetical protein
LRAFLYVEIEIMNESGTYLVDVAREYFNTDGYIPLDVIARLSEAGFIVPALIEQFEKECND